MFSCEFYEIFKNTFFHRTPLVAASEKLRAEAFVRWCLVKKLFFEILLNSQENTEVSKTLELGTYFDALLEFSKSSQILAKKYLLNISLQMAVS